MVTVNHCPLICLFVNVLVTRSFELVCQLQAKSATAGNVFWKGSAWKRAVVAGVNMCPRQDMYKPPSGKKLQISSALTDIQESKQVHRFQSVTVYVHFELVLKH